ncbi:hypothetical protein [Sinorhizobium sp. A49]|uniref:hypothetical protein n=1 Tax=Sinorhizobium sp. A49 TaxID=1945861 RepID=UPI001115AAD1|nr:hypothetical protein [Sinorhizobium sp. A49]
MEDDNETWLVEAGCIVVETKALVGYAPLSPLERLIYCVWVADYGMRNAGDLKAAADVHPPVSGRRKGGCPRGRPASHDSGVLVSFGQAGRAVFFPVRRYRRGNQGSLKRRWRTSAVASQIESGMFRIYLFLNNSMRNDVPRFYR